MVTWNRRALLAESLRAVQQQTLPPAALVVVANPSDDRTAQMLADDFPDVDVVRTANNTGGAGGFAIGLQRALATGVDAVWLMDDDTVPEPDALAALHAARSSYADPTHPGRAPAVVASRVLWTDGRDHPMNTPRRWPGIGSAQRAAAERVACVPVRSASFVSVLVDARRALERGLPVAAYFLWNDDFEYTARLIRGGVGLWCPASVVVHKTAAFGATDTDPGARFFYEVRNKVWLFSRSRSLSRREKGVYAASTVLRWGRTVARSTDRPTLWRELGRGLRAGVAGRPADTAPLVAQALARHQEPPAPAGAGTPPVATAGAEPFSLLMSVWAGDDPGFFEAAFRSVVHEQTRRPDDVVIVQDGPVPAELDAAISRLVHASPAPTTLLALDANVGLGLALDKGMAACAHDIVARMDADDIALPHRFAAQVPLVERGVDLVGSALLEFDSDPGDIVGRRVPPTDPDEIVRSARFLQPFNHPTVVYRRTAVQAAGGYRHLALMEDYLLFAKMIRQGASVANVAEPLVLYRIGAGAYARRGGVQVLRSELSLQRRLHEMEFTSSAQMWRNIIVRGGYRLVPESVRRSAYRIIIARKGER